MVTLSGSVSRSMFANGRITCPTFAQILPHLLISAGLRKNKFCFDYGGVTLE